VCLKYTYICIIFLLLSFSCLKSQTTTPQLTSEDVIKAEGYNPLTPATAAFYSAILPGLGQAYNKQAWKIPFVYGAMATSMYYFTINNTSYKRYRNAFKLREAGYQDEFTLDDGSTLISREGMVSAQKTLKQNRETSLLLFIGFYVLQIVDASVSAHLLQFNVNDKISLDPQIYSDPNTNKPFVGLTFNYTF
jgi:flagellar biosynthesis protein FliP